MPIDHNTFRSGTQLDVVDLGSFVGLLSTLYRRDSLSEAIKVKL